MIEDAEARSEDRFRDRVFDVCVVGTGPAGITLARRLAAGGLDVGLFEGGGLDYTDESQDTYLGETDGQPYYALDACRLRYFGGTSNHWGGWTRPLDAHDFEPLPHHHPWSGWPIAKSDLDPYAAETDAILDLPANFPAPDIFQAGDPGLDPVIFRFSRPVTRFGEKYRQELEAAGNISVFVNASLVDLRTEPDGRRVSAAVFRSYQRPEPFSVRARAFVLCLGGIENARLLLNADSQQPRGLGNEYGLVGSYFLEHPHAPVGKAVLRAAPSWMLAYSPTPAFMRKMEVLNYGLRIGYEGQWNAPEFTGAFQPAPACTASFDAMLSAAMKDAEAPCPANIVDVFVSAEQSLDAANRVALLAERDRFGLRRVELTWQLGEIDLNTLRMAALDAARRLADQDVGRMRVADWLMDRAQPGPNQVWGGNHHMGTTRMSATPERGVVDADCRVHSLDNLYMGGSSVFATSGHANPTYTIVQLALRLGDHLKRKLGRA